MIPVYIINLDEDVGPLQRLEAALRPYQSIRCERVPAMPGNRLPDVVARLLTRNEWSTHNKGTLGVFCSHVSCWQRIVDSDEDFGIVLEDDVELLNIDLFSQIQIPNNAEIIFCNDRSNYLADSEGNNTPKLFDFVPIDPVLNYVAKHRRAIGGDGYILTKSGARKLISFIELDGMFTHVDLRILAYCLESEGVDGLIVDDQSNIVAGLRKKYPLAHKLAGFVANPSLTFHPIPKYSRRIEHDKLGKSGKD